MEFRKINVEVVSIWVVFKGLRLNAIVDGMRIGREEIGLGLRSSALQFQETEEKRK